MNREQADAGEALYANPRNTAAGTMRNLDPALVARRGLSAFTYQLVGAREHAPRKPQRDARGDARLGTAGRAALAALRRASTR